MKNQIEKFISSTVEFHDFKSALDIANNLKTGIEISRFGKLKDIDDKFNQTKAEYKAALADFDNAVTFHGFFSNLNVASKDPLIRDVSIKRYYQSFELACEFGAKTVVFHTCFNNLLKHKTYQELYFTKNVEFFNDFIKNFEKEGIIATIENVHEPNAELIRNLIAVINSEYLKVTLDVGHVNLHSKIPPSEWVKEYGIMLQHVHLHNNDTTQDAHRSLKNGTADIKGFLQTLNDMKLYPEFVFEIFNKEDLFESVEYFNQLCEEIGYNPA